MAANRLRNSILEKPLSKGKSEVHISAFALVFSELVQYCQNRVNSVPELQTKLSKLGYHVGERITDVLVFRERSSKRETKIFQILLFVKITLWKALFGREAPGEIERANDDERVYYIKDEDILVNRFISIPKDKGNLNCAAFVAGIIEAVLVGCGFPAKVTAHWHEGTTFSIRFDDSVIARIKAMENR